MTSFIVISTTESLNRFVDDIFACHPQNPDVAGKTHIGTGKLQQKEDGLYYHYTYGNNIADKSSGTDLYQLLANQIANFRLQAKLYGSELQIFLLENPITTDDACHAWLVYDALKKVIAEKKYENNCHIVHVLFSYDVNSLDVTSQVANNYLAKILSNQIGNKMDIRAHILYLDNQDRNGAAITSTKEEHNLLIPRMLCDFMMLYSSENNSNNVRNVSHNSETQVFSIGYAECMYYFKDIERYYQLAYNRDIRKYYLICSNDTDNRELDYEKSPLGLIERRDLLEPRYADVPYSEDIKNNAESVDKEIDDIVRSNKQTILDIKAHALEEAKLKDEEETEAKRQIAIDNGEDPGTIESVTCHTQAVEDKYPNYIDRNELYKLWLVEHTDEEYFDDNTPCYEARVEYERVIHFIQSSEYKQFIINLSIKEAEESRSDTAKTATLIENKGCNFFVRLFHNSSPKSIETLSEEQTKEEKAVETIKIITSIAKLQNEKTQYKRLCNYIEQVENEIKDYQKQMDDFRLTTHSKSVDNLIILKTLKDYQSDQALQHIDTVILRWRDIKNGTLGDLMQEMKKECANDVIAYKYINWEYPFPFVNKDIDIKNLAIELNKRAIPFVQTYTTRPVKENLTSYIYYHDREEWKRRTEEIDSTMKEYIVMPSGTSTELSTHIESKFCMFQILQMDKDIINGLTDLHTIESD